MKKQFLFLLIFLCLATGIFTESLLAQKSAKLSLEISSDTIGLSGELEVSIRVENAKVKRFNPPNFEGFTVQGPSTSTSMSIVNGDVSQSSTYTYYLKPQETGQYKIGSVSVDTEGVSFLKFGFKPILSLYLKCVKPQSKKALYSATSGV